MTTYFWRRSQTKSAAIPDPFMMITGSLLFNVFHMCAMVLRSPSQTMIAIGTGIPTKNYIYMYILIFKKKIIT